MIRVWKVCGEELTAVAAEEVHDVSGLKRYLRKAKGLPICLQTLIQDGRMLSDAEELNSSVDLQLILLSSAERAKIDGELLFAAESGDTEILRFLLQAAANPDAGPSLDAGPPRATALWKASSNGHDEAVRALLEARADVDLSTYGHGSTAIVGASLNGHVEVVRSLLAAGADVNLSVIVLPDSDDSGDVDVSVLRGFTALIAASFNGHVEVVRLLVEAGADVHDVDLVGDTALTVASSGGHAEVVRLLAEAEKKHGEAKPETCKLP